MARRTSAILLAVEERAPSDQVREQVGDDPEVWMPELMERL
jgi:hypothetical protein